MRVRVMAVTVGLVLLAAACGSSTPEAAPPTTPAPSTTTSTEKPQETRRNKEAIPYTDVVEVSLEDIQDWWAKELPDVFGQEYEPIADTDIYPGTSDDPPPECSPQGGKGTYDEIEGNAFYCPLGKFVAYDEETLFPDLYEKFGEYAIAMVLAHEWGHAIQDQIGVIDSYDTIYIENQADCFAGAWTKHSLSDDEGVTFRAQPKDLQSALGGMLLFSDTPGSDISDQSAHGSGFDRVNGFRLGFDQGVERCADYFPDNLPAIQNIPFTSQDEVDSGGNLDYEDAIDMATIDLNAYWEDLGKQSGFEFTPVEDVVRFSSETDMPECGGEKYSEDEAIGKIFFCVDDNYVAWDDDMLSEVNDEIGDFGTGVLIAQQWSVSAQIQDGLDKDVIESKAGRLQQSCFSGAWAFAVLNGDAHNNGNVSLSPGDLDEAILAFLAFSDTPDETGETETGSAFEQAGAFSDGFFYGESECAKMNL